MSRSDYVLIGLIAILVVFGLLMLSSASASYAINKFDDSYYYLKKQITHGLLPGIFLFFLFLRFDYRRLKKYANWILGGVILFLALVKIPGIGVQFGTAKSWISIGGYFSFQPSEIAKLGLIIFLAAWLEYRNKRKLEKRDTLIHFLVIMGIVCSLILSEPDMGTMGIVFLIGFMVYFASGAPLRYLAGIVIASLAGFFILIRIAPYRMERFTAFLNPSVDPQGIGYHINQAILAIGSGGFFGAGLGHYSLDSIQHLPEVWADSIFAVIGKDLGFLFSVLLVLGFALFMVRGLKIANKAPDEFGKLLALGIVSWIVFQAFINIASMLSLMPLTGVPLPFISYGGTALMATLAGCGILANISKWA